MSVKQIVVEIVEMVSGWEGVSVNPHRFGGHEFGLGNVEIGHIHYNGMVAIPLPHDPDTQTALLEGLDGLNLSQALRHTI